MKPTTLYCVAKRLLIFAALMICGAVLPVHGFQFEGRASYVDGDGERIDTRTRAASLTWYNAPVIATDWPLAEAGFLSRRSSLSYRYADAEVIQRSLQLFSAAEVFTPPPSGSPLISVGPGLGPITTDISLLSGLRDESKLHAGAVRYVHAGSGWFGSLQAGDLRGDTASVNVGRIDGSQGRVEIGRYLAKSTALWIYLQRIEQRSSSEFSFDCPPILVFCIDAETRARSKTVREVAGLGLRHVGRLGGDFYTVTGNLHRDRGRLSSSTQIEFASISPRVPVLDPVTFSFRQSIPDIWQGSVDATWYPNMRLGIGGGYSLSDQEEIHNQVYSLFGRWFVRRNIELRIDLQRADFDAGAADQDRVGLSVLGRF